MDTIESTILAVQERMQHMLRTNQKPNFGEMSTTPTKTTIKMTMRGSI